MEYIKKRWKQIIITIGVIAIFIAALYVSQDAVILEVTGEYVPVVNPVNAVIAAAAALAVGILIFLRRKRAQHIE